jgi:hypothetical protein
MNLWFTKFKSGRFFFHFVFILLLLNVILILNSCPATLEGDYLAQVEDSIIPVITVTSPISNSNYLETVVVTGTVLDGDILDTALAASQIATLRYQITTVLGSSDYVLVDFDEAGSFSFSFSTLDYDDDIALEITASDWNDNTGTVIIRLKDSGVEMPSFSGTAVSKSITLTWEETVDTAQYDLRYTTNGSYPNANYGEPVLAVSPPYTMSSLSNGRLYSFRLISTKTNGDVVESGLVQLVPQSDFTFLPVAVPGEGEIVVSWPETIGVDGFYVFRAEGSDGDFFAISGIIDGNSFTDNFVSSGIDYYYRINPSIESALMSPAVSTRISEPVFDLLAYQSLDTGVQALDIDVYENKAYVALGSDGLIYYDISDPSSMRELDTKTVSNIGGEPVAFDISGDYLYVAANAIDADLDTTYAAGTEAGILIAAVNPAVDSFRFNNGTNLNAVLVEDNNISGTSTVNDITVSGNYAYLAAKSDGMSIMNVTDYTSPTFRADVYGPDDSGYLSANHLNNDFEAYTVGILGSTVFVGSYFQNSTDSNNNHTEVITINGGDTTNPTIALAPEVLGMSASPPRGSTMIDTVLYSAFDTWGLTWFDLGSVSSPVLPPYTAGISYQNASFEPLWCFEGSSGSGNGFAGEDDFIRLLDLADPANPVVLGERSFTATVNDTSVNNMKIYGDSLLIAQANSVVIADLSRIADPTIIGSDLTVSTSGAITVQGSRVFIHLGSQDGFGEFSIVSSDVPVLLGNVNPGAVSGLLLKENLLFITTINPGILNVYDISIIGSPILLDSLSLYSGELGGMAVWGETLVVTADTDGVYLVDFSDPEALITLGHISTSGQAKNVVASKGYAYIADGTNGLVVIDIENTTLIKESTLGWAGTLEDVDLFGDYVVGMKGSTGMTVFDISDPTYPTDLLIGGDESTGDGGTLVSVKNFGNIAVAANSAGEIWLIDVTPGEDPVVFSVLDLVAELGISTIFDLDISGDCVYVTTDSGIVVLGLDMF